MGRFFAPDDEGHRSNNPDNNHHHQAAVLGGGVAEPMDWTLISSDDDEQEHNNIMTNSDDDVMMLARMKLNDNTADEHDVYGSEVGNSACTSRGEMIAYNNGTSLPSTEMMENDNNNDVGRHSPLSYDAITENNATNNNNNNATLLQMTQHCLQQLQLSNDYNHLHQMQLAEIYEQQRRRRKRNKKIIVSVIMIASIIAFVLKLHAPPPPPLVKQNSILALFENKNYYLLEDESLLSSVRDASSSSLSSRRSNNNVNDLTITHHETWGEYTSHIAQITSVAIQYIASVFWYAISNSFRYAALDLRDSIVEVMGDCRNGYRQFLSSSTTVTRDDDDDHEYNGNMIRVNKERVACPIRIQAAWNRHTLLPRGVANNNNNNDDGDGTIMEGFSTEESLRQQLASLPSQNIALQQIAQGIDSWGESMVEDNTYSVDVLHGMARFMTRMGMDTDSIASSSSSSSTTHSVVQHECPSHHDTIDHCDVNDKENVTLKWMLPPAKGFLFVGPAGVGKLHVAQHLANWFFAHCKGNSERSDASCSSDYDDVDNKEKMRNPVLEIIAGDNMSELEGGGGVSRRRSIIEHIQRRKGLGSVIIIHHIEHLGDDGLLSDIFKVLNGHTNTLPYVHDDNDEAASCDGTVFLLTTEQWGTKRIFQMIQQNDGLENLPREGLLSAIRWEVDSHLRYWQRLNSRTTIVPFLPFQQDDLLLVVQSWFQELSDKYQGIHWAWLDVSTSAIKYIVDQMEYLDLYSGGHLQPTKTREGDESQQSLLKPLLTFSANGAHALYENSLYTAVKSELKSSNTRRRPYKAAFLDVNQDTLDYILSWCDAVDTALNECETQWRLPLAFS